MERLSRWEKITIIIIIIWKIDFGNHKSPEDKIIQMCKFEIAKRFHSSLFFPLYDVLGGDLKKSTAGTQKNGDKNTLSKKDMRTEKNIVESYFNFKLNGKKCF